MARIRPLSTADPLDRLLGETPAMQALRAQIRHLARFDAVGHAAVPTVLLHGETGTGKGLVARLIHDSGPRAQGPFLEVNCAAIPETLLEAELFGFAAGAFTDAKHAKPGLFEAATGGTLFLDEIETLPLLLQAKLLTAIEGKRVRRLGAVAERPVDVKLIAAAQMALSEHVTTGRFRADLYHRLAVVVLALPPLRARGEDILVLAQALLQHYGAVHGVGLQCLSKTAEAWLLDYRWPDNVRELSHLMERVVLLEPAAVIAPESLARLCLSPPAPAVPAAPVRMPDADTQLDDAERITQALRQTRGNVLQAARVLGMSRGGLRYRMQRLGLERSHGQTRPPPPALRPGRRPLHPTRSPVRGATAPPGLPAGWEPKPVAVLAIEATWPEMAHVEETPCEPWTVAARWEQSIAEKVAGFGGGVLQGSPSLCLAAFGLPRTLEQLPQRAVQAALAIRHLAAERQEAATVGTDPVVRLAVHLGMLLVDGKASETPVRWLAVGETLAFPVRLLGHAAPGELLVSAPIGRLIAGWVEVQERTLPLGTGQPEQMSAYSVGGVLPQRSPGAWMGTRARSPFLGRMRELATLRAVLEQVEGGRGRAVGIVGEPGMGKSRLLDEWRQHLMAQEVAYLEGHCLSYGNATPYLPVLDLLRAHCGITPADGDDAITEKVRESLHAVGLAPDAGAPYLLHLLGVGAAIEQVAGVSPDTLKAKTFETLRQLWLQSSQRRPLILAVEDLHWSDPTSEEFFASLVERLPGAALLVLGTYRPGYRPAWLEKSYATQLTVPPLSAQDSVHILRVVLQRETIPPPLAEALLAKAQGNPFFLEELAQTLVEQVVVSGAPTSQSSLPRPAPTDLQLPSTVQAVLAVRIDRLPAEEKCLLQIAAVLGTEVPLPLLHAIADVPEAVLQRHLDALQSAEFLYETPPFLERIYTFKHTLTQEVAYSSLLLERRRVLHARIVEALEALVPDRMAEQVERLTHHALRGEVWSKAVTYCQQAGTKAFDRAAFHEAATAFEQALQALAHLPTDGNTRERAIDLRLALGGPLSQLGEHRRCRVLLDEAEALARTLDDRARLGWVLVRLSFVCRQTGDLDGAMAAGRQALALAVALDDGALQGNALWRLAPIYYAIGDFNQAAELLRRNVESVDRESHRPRTNMRIQSRAFLARTLSELGAFTEGRRHGEEALRSATLSGRGNTPIIAHANLGYLYLAQGDLEHTIRVLEPGLALCRASGDSVNLRYIAVGLGCAFALQGRLAEGRALLEEAIREDIRTGALEGQAFRVAGLSEVCRLAGRGEEAWQHARQALDLARQQKARGNEACALHQLGVVQAHADPPDVEQAEAHYQQALALADELGMRPLQAHCHLSLGILYSQTGQPEQARAELSAAISLYRAMDMTFWLPKAEATLAQVV